MSLEHPKYDVAISFLAGDQKIAEGLYGELSKTLEVFYYPKSQEQLAGTDGMESMRAPFLEDSHLMVVLYREGWGNTRWTAVEERAIKDRCFDEGWNHLFFIALDRSSPLPKYLPDYRVRFNWEDFGLQQAAGAIKARVLEAGGKTTPMTPAKRAELLKAEDTYRLDKSMLNTVEGWNSIKENARLLCVSIGQICDRIKSDQRLQIDYEITEEFNASPSVAVTDGLVGMAVCWYQPYSNTLDKSRLEIREYPFPLFLKKNAQSRGNFVYFGQRHPIRERHFEAELSRARELGWKGTDAHPEFIATTALAEQCIIEFLDLVEKRKTGNLEDYYTE